MNLSEIKKACRFLNIEIVKKSKLQLLNEIFDVFQKFEDVRDSFYPNQKGKRIYCNGSHIFGFFHLMDSESWYWIQLYHDSISIEIESFPFVDYHVIKCYHIANKSFPFIDHHVIKCYHIADNCYVNDSIITSIIGYAEFLNTTVKFYKNEQMIFAEIVNTTKVFAIACIDITQNDKSDEYDEFLGEISK